MSPSGRVRRTSIHINPIRMIPPRYSPTTNCQPKKMAMMMPSSMTRLVEASRKAREGMKPAPFAKSERVVASAANEQELEMKPKPVPSATLFAPASPIDRCMRSRVTNTWIMSLTT